MATRISQKEIEQSVSELCSILNLPTNKDQAIHSGRDRFIAIDHAAVYGGYRLVSVLVKGGGHTSALGFSAMSERLPAKEFLSRIQGLITFYYYLEDSRKQIEALA